ncbi:unnamed protein product [Symbiodinium necroappetens]|uniref:F-box domain-containing protein n=1 Tax=Symbiodinium necroappetens TaxID=1628268 RepID=A0A813CGI3_9DINO|nr:unnamed protein product [Symbiodinium necroappetens]
MGQLPTLLWAEPLPLPDSAAAAPVLQPTFPLHKLLLCLRWLPSSSLLAAELCCRELRDLVLQRGFLPDLCLNEEEFLGSCEGVVSWLEERASRAGCQKLRYLETLSLRAMPTLTESHVHRLLKICPGLKYLDLSDNEETLMPQVMDLLREAAPPLEALVLPTLRASHFRAVSTLVKFPELKVLDLPLHHQPVTSAIIQSSRLRSLRLTSTLQDDLLKLLAEGGLPQLEDVWLLRCPGPVLAEAAKRCPLKSIGIAVEPPCDFESLTRIIEASGSRLQFLNIPSRLQAGQASRNIGDLLAELCPELQGLCMHTATLPLTTAGLSQLLHSCTKLHRVSLSHVQGSCRLDARVASWTNCSSKHGQVMYSDRQHALCGHDGAVTTMFAGGGSGGGRGGGGRHSSHPPQQNDQPSSSFSSRGLGSGAPAPVGPKRLALASCERLGLLFGSFFFSTGAGDCCFAIRVAFRCFWSRWHLNELCSSMRLDDFRHFLTRRVHRKGSV